MAQENRMTSEQETAWENSQIAAHARKETAAALEARDYVTHGQWLRDFREPGDLDVDALAKIDTNWREMSKEARVFFAEDLERGAVPDDHPFVGAIEREAREMSNEQEGRIAQDPEVSRYLAEGITHGDDEREVADTREIGGFER